MARNTGLNPINASCRVRAGHGLAERLVPAETLVGVFEPATSWTHSRRAPGEDRDAVVVVHDVRSGLGTERV